MYSLMFIYICIFSITVNGRAVTKNKLLLISFDGFRYDYIEHYKPKSFLKLVSSGVHASSGMIPVFPTKTFPNHYSLVTGLYPESHGLVDNNMYDPDYNETFELNVDTETKWFDQAEPIWITARLNGLITGVHCWPGSSTKLHGTQPNYYEEFNVTIPFKKRVNDTINWFVQHDASFVALYFEEPDSTGHKYGVLSDKVKEMVDTVDDTLDYLLKQLEKHNLYDTMNIIIISDHGMLNTSRNINENLILDKYLDPSDYLIIPQTGPVASILPQEGKLHLVYDKLKNANSHVKVYYKEDLPERLHYRNNRRIMPIIAIADEHYQIMMTEDAFHNSYFGQHGYDNELESMKATFLASGPTFKASVTIQPFQNFHIYSLMCHILGIQPLANNGSLEVFNHVMKTSSSAAISFTSCSLGNLITILILTYYNIIKYFF